MRISVVIPLYNKAEFIKRALDSVLAQTVEDYEIIVVDDGSTDDGSELVAKYADHRIRLLCQKNSGVSTARNRGIAESCGRWVSFLDADDAWKPNYLNTVSMLTEKYPAAGAYATAYEIVYPTGKSFCPKYSGIPRPPWYGLLPNYFRSAMRFPPVCASAVTVPKRVFEHLGAFPVGIRVGEDVDMWGRIALRYPIAFSTEVGASYFQDDRLRHTSRKSYFSTSPEAVFVKTANSAIQRGEVKSIDLKDLRDYTSKIQIDLGRDCLVNARNPVAARKILTKSYPCSLQFRWKKYRLLAQTYLPGILTRMVYGKKL